MDNLDVAFKAWTMNMRFLIFIHISDSHIVWYSCYIFLHFVQQANAYMFRYPILIVFREKISRMCNHMKTAYYHSKLGILWLWVWLIGHVCNIHFWYWIVMLRRFLTGYQRQFKLIWNVLMLWETSSDIATQYHIEFASS